MIGRGLSRAGAITLDDNFASLSEPATLAIKLSSIDAVNEGRQNRISWVTESEDVGDFAELERSDGRTDFAQIATVPGNAKPSSYTYVDKRPFAGPNLYRLKLKDALGNFTYSRTVTASMKTAVHSIEVYPNPANNKISIVINGPESNNKISLTDLNGREIKQLLARDNRAEADITDLPPGVYFIKYFDGTRNQSVKLLKQ